MSLGGLARRHRGLIIDDTVVVIENIGRHLTPGSTEGSTASYQTRCVIPWMRPPEKSPVPSSVPDANHRLGLCAAGVHRRRLWPILRVTLSWSLSIAVLVSMVISLTLIPVFAAKFLEGRPMPGPGPIYQFMANIYERMLDVALGWPKLTLGISVVAVAVGIVHFAPAFPILWKVKSPGKPPPAPLFKGIQTGLMPEMDEGAFVVDYWAPRWHAAVRDRKLMARVIEADIIQESGCR